MLNYFLKPLKNSRKIEFIRNLAWSPIRDPCGRGSYPILTTHYYVNGWDG